MCVCRDCVEIGHDSKIRPAWVKKYFLVVVYYEETKRELKRVGREHLKIETRLRDERFESVKGECVI